MSFDFIAGFLISMIGICMISFNGTELSLNPLGDMLAVLAAFVWAVYSIITKRIGRFGYNVIASTRKTFFYAIIFMIPALFIFGFDPQLEYFHQPKYLFNIMFLGFGVWKYLTVQDGAPEIFRHPESLCIFLEKQNQERLYEGEDNKRQEKKDMETNVQPADGLRSGCDEWAAAGCGCSCSRGYRWQAGGIGDSLG